MSRSPNSHAGLRRHGAFLGQIERANNPRGQAFNHNLGRNVRVVKLLTVIGLMRQAGKSLTGTVTCAKAERQNFSSESNMTVLGITMGAMEAAHFLPGTISIGGVPLWAFANDAETRGYIEALFADVEHLPVVFNQADTAAEAKHRGGGLCAALASACQSIVAGPIAGPGSGGSGGGGSGPPMGALQAAHKFWQAGALIGLRNAMTGKANRGVLPDLVKDAEGNIDLSPREAASKAAHNRDDAVRILGYYLEDQNERDWTWVQTGCRTAIDEAVAEFKS
jgi:hypothetical protein